MDKLIIRNWNVLVNPEGLKGHWITGEEIGRHLGYAEPRIAIAKIYDRNKESFKEELDTSVTKLVTEAGLRETRIYSERGCLKVTRFSRTDRSDEIMEEVFEVFLEVKRNEKANASIPGIHPLMQQAQQMMANAQQVLQLTAKYVQVDEEQKRQAEKMRQIEAKQDAVLKQSGYYSILAFANLKGIELSLELAKQLGIKAAKRSREKGIPIDKVPDPRFGRVGAYHESILDELFQSQPWERRPGWPERDSALNFFLDD